MEFIKGQAVELIEVSEGKALTGRYKVGLRGEITKIDYPGKNYHMIKWENGEKSDSHKDRIKIIN